MLPTINPELFLHILRDSPIVAFQRTEYGFAIADEASACYAPMAHKGGGNLDEKFAEKIADASLWRMSHPRLRTLRPNAKPTPTHDLMKLSGQGQLDAMANYATLAGDLREVIEYETQVVILAMAKHGRPDLKEAISVLKRDMLAECMDLVLQHAEAVRELCEVGADPPPARRLRVHLGSASSALQNALAMLLDP